MTDYERILTDAKNDPKIEEVDEWETIDGELAITLSYNMYYQETITFNKETGEQIDKEVLYGK